MRGLAQDRNSRARVVFALTMAYRDVEAIKRNSSVMMITTGEGSKIGRRSDQVKAGEGCTRSRNRGLGP